MKIKERKSTISVPLYNTKQSELSNGTSNDIKSRLNSVRVRVLIIHKGIQYIKCMIWIRYCTLPYCVLDKNFFDETSIIVFLGSKIV